MIVQYHETAIVAGRVTQGNPHELPPQPWALERAPAEYYPDGVASGPAVAPGGPMRICGAPIPRNQGQMGETWRVDSQQACTGLDYPLRNPRHGNTPRDALRVQG